tara:strand:+ start:899 stop:1036 length:138 start_codon:yes stop_codon:yes gene_type:complete
MKKFKKHFMYKNGKAVMADTFEKHLRFKKQGYTHTKPRKVKSVRK